MNETKENILQKELDHIKRQIAEKNQEINYREAEILQMNNLLRDKINREQLNSRNIKEIFKQHGVALTNEDIDD